MKILLCLVALALTACQAAEKSARNVGYSAYELVGVEKRDLLRKRINEATEDQKEAGESFTNALDRLQQTYGVQGSELEKVYSRLNSAYEDAKEEVAEVKNSREKMNTVAGDLFEEWKKEIGEMQSADLKSRSRATLAETKNGFDKMHSALRASEKQMEPVLAKLKDHTLFLKHNVNAQSVASLKTEGARIEGDIQKLLASMTASIKEAEEFTKQIQ
jgi:hypothetical protein